jgi:hypothetical protein
MSGIDGLLGRPVLLQPAAGEYGLPGRRVSLSTVAVLDPAAGPAELACPALRT